MSRFTNAELAKEAAREVAYRQVVFSDLVNKGEVSPHEAERRIATMEAIAEHFQKLADAEEEAGRLL